MTIFVLFLPLDNLFGELLLVGLELPNEQHHALELELAPVFLLEHFLPELLDLLRHTTDPLLYIPHPKIPTAPPNHGPPHAPFLHFDLLENPLDLGKPLTFQLLLLKLQHLYGLLLFFCSLVDVIISLFDVFHLFLHAVDHLHVTLNLDLLSQAEDLELTALFLEGGGGGGGGGGL